MATIFSLQSASVLMNLMRNPLKTTTQSVNENQGIRYFHTMGQNICLLSHPDYIQQVLNTNYRNYSKETPFSSATSVVVGNGLGNAEGQFWLRQRRLMQPSFSHKNIAQLVPTMVDAITTATDHWDSCVNNNTPINISQDMTKITSLVTVKTLLGGDLDSSKLQDITDSINTLLSGLTQYMVKESLPSWVPMPPSKGFATTLDFFNGLVYDLIEETRKNPTSTSLLSMLITVEDQETGETMSDQQIRDEVITLLLAGLETTATTAAWLWYFFAQQPQAQEVMYNEVDTVLQGRVPTFEDLMVLPYIRAFIQEVLRFYPPGWLQMRKAIDNDQIGDVEIQGGTTVIILPYATHHDTQWWDDPDTFTFSRFYEQDPAKHRFAYIPFGAGARKCIANEFAMMELQMIMTLVLQKYNIKLASETPIAPKASIALKPSTDVEVLLTPRR